LILNNYFFSFSFLNLRNSTQNMSYAASNITVLNDLEAVRLRPGMYIGNTGKEGLHRCLGEVLDNSVDELVKFCCR
jgi:DNA gyrase subunit B